MKFIIDLLKLSLLINLYNFVANFFKQLWNFLAPPLAFSWQTLILLSVFSYFMGFFATEPVQDILASMGWIFLIFGISWVTSENENQLKISGLSVGPWITSALVCVFVFGSWRGNFTLASTQATLICWPPLAATLHSVRDFFDTGLKFKIPQTVARQNIVILLLSNLLISCWLQFYFTTQYWLDQYPTLLEDRDNFSKSAFVMKLDTPQTLRSRGYLIINSMESSLQRELTNKPWPQVERWLLPQEREARMDALKQQVQRQLPQATEDLWWRFNYKVSSIKSGYNLQMQATWVGPQSERWKYSIKKSCQITPIYKQSRGATNSTPISQVECQA